MIKRTFGPQGRPVPIIGQGTWNMPTRGSNQWTSARDALRAGIDAGMVHIDTAEMYGDGQAEELVGEALREYRRDELFVVSKVLPTNATYEGTIAACEASLRNLRLDYLDCYLLHWRGSIPLSETMRAMEKLVADGKILSLGVSNFDLYDLSEAESCLSREKIACNQVLYHLWERGIERRLVGYCEKRSIAVVGYTPFGQRGLPSPDSVGGEVLSSIASKHGATIRQVMLAFLVRFPNLFTIPKASRPEHARENAGAGSLALDAADIELIDETFPAPSKDVPLAML